MNEKVLKCYEIFSLIKCIISVVEKKKEKIETKLIGFKYDG